VHLANIHVSLQQVVVFWDLQPNDDSGANAAGSISSDGEDLSGPEDSSDDDDDDDSSNDNNSNDDDDDNSSDNDNSNDD